jgi:hypothetical protein
MDPKLWGPEIWMMLHERSLAMSSSKDSPMHISHIFQAITQKDEWYTKIFDPVLTKKWEEELKSKFILKNNDDIFKLEFESVINILKKMCSL